MERPSDYIAKMNKTAMTRFNRFFLSEFFYVYKHIQSLYIYKYHYILYYITFASKQLNSYLFWTLLVVFLFESRENTIIVFFISEHVGMQKYSPIPCYRS